MSATGSRPSSRPAFVVAVLTTLLAACDLGPKGPTQVLGTVTGNPQLGAAAIDISWDGITGIEGRADTRVYSAPVSGSPGRHRAVLVNATGGELRFTIELPSDRLHAPVVTVVSAVGSDNLALPVGNLRVVLER